MRILIVEDDSIVRTVLRRQIRARKPGAQILEAATLDDAKLLLPDVDAVLCDGSFPTHRVERPETMSGNWAPVMMACDKVGIPFVLLSGNGSLVGKLRVQGRFAYLKGIEDSTAILVVLQTAQEKLRAASDPPATECGAGEGS